MTVDSGQTWMFTRARRRDAPVMRQLARLAYSTYVDRIGREPAPMTSDYEQIASSGTAILVWRESRVDGMLVFSLEADGLLVENIAVSPQAQGSGLGSALLAQAERLAVKRGKQWVRLYTNEAMVENLAFYPRRGYVETHRGTVDGYARVYFAKQLHLE
ncbi:GNAT family N-acetyltransferase [Herbiconiux sp. YIM B11900]|uniref:GNAT family N-acetyltransferase n=1 Tax=Herbiconiux sp. YIM B11900 TaxID=3404131 RepID=UPI003F869C1C